ncbi:MAG TPA: hypothetical protein VEX36_01910, partial [Thermoleophilaceae bacterium]|nr:hypothetical protein [Thermoleophilaceae bacterium]
AIQRYIEDPLADEVLAQNLDPGSTVEVAKAPDDDEREVTITVIKPARKREAVGVGASGDEGENPALEGGEDEGSDEGSLPDDPEVLPDVPDSPPDDQ